MTPERARYFASISNEERAIRQYIASLKTTITILKALCKDDKSAYALRKDKQEISKFKTIIKALKKQLPQEPIYHDWGIRYCYYCPTCHFIINHYENRCKDGCCCSACGQKLG